MKRIISIVAIAASFTFVAPMVSALNSAEKIAQQKVYDYLKSNRYQVEIDNEDGSVNFMSKTNEFYYITFKGLNGGILYTLHAKSWKLDNRSAEQQAMDRENAVVTANYMNIAKPYKTYVQGNKIEFAFPIFAQTGEEYVKILERLITSMAKSKDSFSSFERKAKAYTDSIHKSWKNGGVDRIVLAQPVERAAMNTVSIMNVVDPMFRNVNSGNTVLSNYGTPLKKSDLQFVETKISVLGVSKGKAIIGMNIIAPNGKLIVPSTDAKRTLLQEIDVDKKPKEVILNPFGTSDPKFWQDGEYTVEFYDGDKLLEKTSFYVSKN